jgi:hypothetical protein
MTGAKGPRGEIAFFAPDRPGIGTIPVRQQKSDGGRQVLVIQLGNSATATLADGNREEPPLFHVLSASIERPPSGTVPIYEFRQASGPARYYSVTEAARPGYIRTTKPMGRVWMNPSHVKFW